MPDGPIINLRSDDLTAENRLFVIRHLAEVIYNLSGLASLRNPPNDPKDEYQRIWTLAALILRVTEKGE